MIRATSAFTSPSDGSSSRLRASSRNRLSSSRIIAAYSQSFRLVMARLARCPSSRTSNSCSQCATSNTSNQTSSLASRRILTRLRHSKASYSAKLSRTARQTSKRRSSSCLRCSECTSPLETLLQRFKAIVSSVKHT